MSTAPPVNPTVLVLAKSLRNAWTTTSDYYGLAPGTWTWARDATHLAEILATNPEVKVLTTHQFERRTDTEAAAMRGQTAALPRLKRPSKACRTHIKPRAARQEAA